MRPIDIPSGGVLTRPLRILWPPHPVFSVAVTALLAGCATPPAAPAVPTTFSGICGMKPIGENEEGIAFALVHCEAKKP